MPENHPLIQKISAFLEQEKEMYGDFDESVLFAEEIKIDSVSKSASIAEKQSQPTSQENTQKPNVPEAKVNEQVKVSEKPQQSSEKQPSLKEVLAACSNLEELRTLCERTEALKTDLAGTNLVFGVGNPTADLMLIGEAPGEQEDAKGEPFLGKAGQLLNKILEAINFRREDVYIANILKHRPPNNRDPLPEERKRSLPYLYRQISLIRPKLILCLGKVSANTLLRNELAMKDMRGAFHNFHGIELMVTYHPAALLRNPQWKRSTWHDVKMLRNRYDELGAKS